MRLAGVLLLLAVTFNAPADTATPGDYRYYKPPTHTLACVQVEWVKDETEAVKRCKGGWGCYYAPAGGQPGLLVAPRVRSFSDALRLHILGHEFLHALGAQHD